MNILTKLQISPPGFVITYKRLDNYLQSHHYPTTADSYLENRRDMNLNICKKKKPKYKKSLRRIPSGN